MRFRLRLRLRVMMLLVLVVGLVAGLAVQVMRTRHTHKLGRGGGSGGSVWVTEDGTIEIEQENWYGGSDEFATPIRWAVSVTPLGSSQPIFAADYGTQSMPAPSKDVLTGLLPYPTIYRSHLRKSLPLKLAPGDYGVAIETRDGLQIRNQTGKIVARNRTGGTGMSWTRVTVK